MTGDGLLPNRSRPLHYATSAALIHDARAAEQPGQVDFHLGDGVKENPLIHQVGDVFAIVQLQDLERAERGIRRGFVIRAADEIARFRRVRMTAGTSPK